jgi:hypothetical protein
MSEENSKKSKGWIMGLAGAAAAGGGFLWWTHDVSVLVIGHHWETHIEIENLAARSQEAWCKEMPNDAYNVKRSMKIREHKKIKDGETCTNTKEKQPDGSFKEKHECQPKYREEPVYDSSCQFDVNRWGFARNVSAFGDGKTLQWGTVQFKCTGEMFGCERESARKKKLFLSLKDPETQQSYRCEVPENIWQTTQTNSKLTLKVSNVTGGERCGSLSFH